MQNAENNINGDELHRKGWMQRKMWKSHENSK